MGRLIGEYMFIKVDENGNIISHDYVQTTDCTIEIANTVLIVRGESFYRGCYKYKYINSELVELSENEIKIHPCRIENKLSEIREARNKLLNVCDYVMISDSDASENCKNAFAIYRQALRDITINIDVDNFNWPSKPAYEKAGS
jgi:hypothetical protein